MNYLTTSCLLVTASTLHIVASSVSAAEIRVYSGGAPRAAMKLLVADFEQATGHKVAVTFDGVSGIRDRLASGEKADVILLPTPMIEAMDKVGTVIPSSRALLARSGIGVVVRRGGSVPDISTPEAEHGHRS